MKITIVGSLGNFSKPLAESLIAEGHDITIFSSDHEKKRSSSDLALKPLSAQFPTLIS
jgi:NAD(P)H dehydrogenase (quinone)